MTVQMSKSSRMRKTVKQLGTCPIRIVLVIAIVSLSALAPVAESCTTIAVGKEATTDGSVLCSHSNDGEGDTDPRLVRIPASDWAPNSTRPVFFSPESFPRYVGTERASTPVPAYLPSSDSAAFRPICSIPQVSHTYAYMEETYGALNSRQLGIAESTCSGVFGAAPMGILTPDGTPGRACFSVDALTQIAMERHHTARGAIREMGDLAVRMGFYGAGLFEGTAESLLVTDKEEAWVFHILPDPTGSSAIWAAQRVPDDSFVVVSNAFIIREIDLAANDSTDFMYSTTMLTVAEDLGWWTPESGQPFDFTAIYSDGEYAHKYYSGRRSWGVFNLFTPSQRFDPEYEEWRISKPYPFSAKPDHKLALQDLADAMRYFYQGTQFSQAGHTSNLTLAGGPWHNPDHVAGGSTSIHNPTPGNWERTIGLYRSSDTYIVQSRNWLPDEIGGTLWWGAYAAPYATYVPFPAGSESLPDATLGHHLTLNKDTFFWANRYVGNYVQLKWEVMMEEVREFQNDVLRASLAVQAAADAAYLTRTARGEDSLTALDTALPAALAAYRADAAQILRRTWDLADHLMFKYADGQIHYTIPADGPMATTTSPREFDANGVTTKDVDVIDQPGYPEQWLAAVEFGVGPSPPPNCEDLGWRCGHRPGVGIAASNLRVGGAGDSNLGEGKDFVSDWRKYSSRKAEAFEKGTSGCFLRGDVSAAVGRSTCRGKATWEDVGRGSDDEVERKSIHVTSA